MDASLFNRLPSELRSYIFELVLAFDFTIPLWHRRNYTPLLETCSQVRQETIPIFYGSNVFAYSFHSGQHPLRPDISRLVRHLKSLGSRALHFMKALYIDWHKFSAQYTSTIQVITIQQIDAGCFLDRATANDSKGHPARHFRPAHVESEIIDLYRSMGLSVRPGQGQGSWLLMPASCRSVDIVPKLEFWSGVWDSEAETLEDPGYWKRDSAKQLLRMLCGSPSIAEELAAEEA